MAMIGKPKEYDIATIKPNTAADIVFLDPLEPITIESRKSQPTATPTEISDITSEGRPHAK